MAKEIAVTVWGYNKLHGRSLTVLAAMAQYGLTCYQGGNVGITDDAFTIIGAPRNSLERKVALERCAKLPTIFEELYQSYAENLPSDDALIWTLKQRGFTDEGAQITVGCLRDTNMFVREELKDYTGGNEVKEVKNETIEQNKGSSPMPPMQQISLRKPPLSDFVLSFTLLTGKNVTLTISGGKPTSVEIGFTKELLNTHLSMYEKKLPKEEEPKE